MNIEKINYCSEKKRYILNHYESFFDSHAFSDNDTFRFMDWESRDAQFTRFYVLAENISMDNKSILDVGCGLGDLYHFLKTLGIHFRYKGIDFSRKCIEKCRMFYPGVEFAHNDVFMETNNSGEERFDVVFCSGLFNLNVENNYDLLRYAVKYFFSVSSEYVVFNLLSSNSQNKEDRYFYFSSADVLDIVSRFPFRGVKIIEDYLENDFTLVCSKV